MPGKEQRLRRLDVRAGLVEGTNIVARVDDIAPPAPASVPAPGTPSLSSVPYQSSSATPSVLLSVVWAAPGGVTPGEYLVQLADDTAFAVNVLAYTTKSNSLGVPVRTGPPIYARVRAFVGAVGSPWSPTGGPHTPAADLTAPGPPTSVAAVFLTSGALRVSWAKPASTNFKSVEIRIFNSAAKAVEYDLISEADGTIYDWPAARNRTQSVGGPDGSPDAAVFVELRSRSWGAVLSTMVSASATLARPANVTGTTATWDGATGTCTFRWTAVGGAAGYALTIDGVPRTVLGAEYAYLRDRNAQDHAGTADPVLDYSLVAVDALDQTSVTPATGTATLARPATPASSAHSWASAASTASADWLLTWTQGAGIVGYRLTLDGLARDLPLTNRYPYPFALNAQEHSGVADPVLDYSLVGVDALGQTSTTPASGTATNAAPPVPSAVALIQLFAGFRADLTATFPADFLTYRYRITQTSPAASDVTVDDVQTSLTRPVITPATYRVGVRTVDLFNQASTELLSSTLLVDALTLALLRERLTYSDSLSTAPATLKAALADGALAAGGIAYASNAGWVRSILADWQLLERTEVITLSILPASGTTTWYLRTSTDNATWAYWSGPAVATGATGQNTTLTSVASEAAAQTAALSSATLGNSASARIDLPSVQELRYVELWLRNTAAVSTVREFFPRRLVQADDLEAEAIRAINISAGAVTTDKMTIPGTASIDATLRLIAFRVPVSLDVDSGIYQGTGTFASPTTGLKLWNNAGIGRLATYNASVVQVQLDSTGRLIAGGGDVVIDVKGVALTMSTADVTVPVFGQPPVLTGDERASLRWANAAGAVGGSLAGYTQNLGLLGKRNLLFLRAFADEADNRIGLIMIDASSFGADARRVGITLGGTGSGAAAGLAVLEGITTIVRGNAVTVESVVGVSVTGSGLNVGTATGAVVGEIRASSGINAIDASTPAKRILMSYNAGSDTGDITAVHDAVVFKPLRLQPIGGAVGFFGSSGTTRPTVTGSRGGNAALASALTALANLGLITDSSTA